MMGAWGIGNFENDDALDWLFQLDDASDTALIKQTLKRIRRAKELESPDCCAALAAAELVAAMRGKPARALPDSAAEYLERVRTAPAEDTVRLALDVTAKIRSRSELRDLWEESGELENWLAELAALEERLQP